MPSHKPRRSAFTLVELLVVIAIIGVLIALLLPAVQAAREAARRSQCTNHLKQVGLALHNHHDSYKAFPKGHNYAAFDASGWATQTLGSWIVPTLPYMEEKALYDTYVKTDNWWAPANQPARAIAVPGLRCPSDVDVENFNTGTDFGYRGNYVGNAGFGKYKRKSFAGQDELSIRGPFTPDFRARFSDLTDGSSKTAAVSEIRKVQANDSRGALYSDAGSVQYTHDFLPNERVADETERCVNVEPDLKCISNGSAGPHRLTVRSNHSGGVNVLMFDGSVRFVTNNVNRDTWKAAASMSGGETLGEL